MGLVGGGAVTGGQSAGGAGGGGGGIDYDALPEVYAEALDELGVVHHWPFEVNYEDRVGLAHLEPDDAFNNVIFDGTHAAGIEATQCAHHESSSVGGDVADYSTLQVDPAKWTFLIWFKALTAFPGNVACFHWGAGVNVDNSVSLAGFDDGRDGQANLRDDASAIHQINLTDGPDHLNDWYLAALRCQYDDGEGSGHMDLHWRSPSEKTRAKRIFTPGSTFDPAVSENFSIAGGDDKAIWGAALFDTLLEDAAIEALESRGRA